MGAVGAVVKTVSGSILLTSVFSIFLGGSMALLWELVNTIQILIYMPLMSLKTPGFLFAFYQALNEFSFNFLDLEKKLIDYFGLESTI
jgi:hypothetical protein